MITLLIQLVRANLHADTHHSTCCITQMAGLHAGRHMLAVQWSWPKATDRCCSNNSSLQDYVNPVHVPFILVSFYLTRLAVPLAMK